jgi:hypothetical protein
MQRKSAQTPLRTLRERICFAFLLCVKPFFSFHAKVLSLKNAKTNPLKLLRELCGKESASLSCFA